MTPLSTYTTDNTNNCDRGYQKGLKPKSRCREKFHVGMAFNHEVRGHYERIGCGGCLIGECWFGKIGVGGEVWVSYVVSAGKLMVTRASN